MLVFEPHQRNRTKKLFNEFAASFDGADALILSEIYEPAGRESEEDRDVNSVKLAGAVLERDKMRGVKREIFYARDLNEARILLLKMIQPGDLIICMGAGAIDSLARTLVK